ncbi:MAG: mannose-6-phosphate isomerase, class I, partial [Tepidisphaerales bacterium]
YCIAVMECNQMHIPGSLRASLAYQPQPLKFGTSGRRGDVVHLTQLEIYINATAEIEYLQSLPAEEGGIRRGDEFFYASDLRPSSSAYVPEQGGRGEIAQAIEQAIRDAGMRPVNLGLIPTPALTCYAIQRGRGSIMITGSHIPFDRNGYKTNTAHGELLKKDEAPINARVEQVRQRLYDQPAEQSSFGADGLFKSGHRELSPADPVAREAYIKRYTEFFAGRNLKGMRLLAYQHSAVGRDLLVELLRRLGAEVIPAGQSNAFVPIDTEAIDAAQLAVIQDLAVAGWRKYGRIDAVISTDGDSDRPLILAVEPAAVPMPSPAFGCDEAVVPDGEIPCRVRFFGGDLVGMVVAEYLRADAVVVPISCNDAVDRGALKAIVEPKTRIGSPFVIAGMQQAREKGRAAVCGWEANGGFLTGSDFTLGTPPLAATQHSALSTQHSASDGRTLAALPTRDAMLPILGVLFSAREKGLSLSALFDRLPARYSKAALLRKFPRPTSLKIIERFSPTEPGIADVVFDGNLAKLRDADGNEITDEMQSQVMLGVRHALAEFFHPGLGFGEITRLNYTDGVRIYFANGDVAHVRPSGNADELRIYAVADAQARADEIVGRGIAEPDGILRRLEQAVAVPPVSSPAVGPVPSVPPAGFAFESSVYFRVGDVDAKVREFSEADLEERRARLDSAARYAASIWFGTARGFARLAGAVQHYEWGGTEFIPSLLGKSNSEAKPFAELWMGAHPSAPSLADLDGTPVPVTELIRGASVAILGQQITERFAGRLPYLFKVLDARKMLSIQAHPTLAQAKEGFERENAAGIPLKDPTRNYKDDNHKPEVHVALTEFWMLHGFRPLEQIVATLQNVPEFGSINFDSPRGAPGSLSANEGALMPRSTTAHGLEARATMGEAARAELLRSLYETIMTMPQERVDAILGPLLQRLASVPVPDKSSPDFWALRAAEQFPLPGGHFDRGIFSIYLLNLVHLNPGEGTYQPAGTLHAYLEGVNVELMANSDNVLRGGLTPKHVDVPELMRIVDFSDGCPDILKGEAVSPAETIYRTPAKEFELSRISVAAGTSFVSGTDHSADILIVLDGAATVKAGDESLPLKRGEIVLAPAGLAYTVEGVATLYKASVPQG